MTISVFEGNFLLWTKFPAQLVCANLSFLQSCNSVGVFLGIC